MVFFTGFLFPTLEHRPLVELVLKPEYLPLERGRVELRILPP